MVIHMVHEDAEGNLAVVAILLQPGAQNSLVQTLWDHLPKQKGITSTLDDVHINPSALIPSSGSYYTFMGSLTTPPCSEHVRWFVMESPVSISPEEVNTFAALYPLNARPTQPLNGRVVREEK